MSAPSVSPDDDSREYGRDEGVGAGPPDVLAVAAPVLRVVDTLRLARCGLEARLLEAARVTVAACGDGLLTAKDFCSVEELSPRQLREWRGQAKAAAQVEVQATMGIGAEEARQLVAVACAPAPVLASIVTALDAGVVSWFQVRAFWRRSAQLDPEAALLVAQALFSLDPADVDVVAVERLTPDGKLSVGPWQHQAYAAALEREAVAVEGADVAAERERRRRARQAAKKVSLAVHDDGTATLSVTGEVIDLCAAYTRIERCARLLRKHGAERPLDQLREAVARVLLIHGRIDLPDTDDPAQVSEDDWERFTQVLNGHATIAMQVVIPWDALTNASACTHCGHGLPTQGSAGDTGDQADEPGQAAQAAAADPQLPLDHHDHDDECHERPVTCPLGQDPGEGSARPPGQRPAALGEGSARRPVRGPVGRVLGVAGVAGVFMTPGHARELALRPGTTFYRLLTDPADGRLIERTIRAYRPDADMRRQIIAADVTARIPWSTHPAHLCERDHVTPYSADDTGTPTGGRTCELNLASLPKTPHELKTKKLHAAAINHRRDLTWTTLLAAELITRVHDYRQYTQDRAPQAPGHPGAGLNADLRAGQIAHLASAYRRAAHTSAATTIRAEAATVGAPVPDWVHDPHVVHPPDGDAVLDCMDTTGATGAPLWAIPHLDLHHPVARDVLRDLACQALYAALATRGPGAFLQDEDDAPDASLYGGPGSGWITITHTAHTGARRRGPAPDQPTPEHVIGLADTGAPGENAADEDTPGEDTPGRHDGQPPF